ncbi:hypothetical protein J26TS2_00100 [Shouchella clausii]|nr:hypothetical protein J26TS2_00100 [Shouchella clausii]
MAKTEPVVLTKEQAAALDWVSKNYGNSFAIRLVSTSVQHKPKCWSKPETVALNGLSLDELARALYVGYEVKRTQEERYEDVREAYRNAIALENYDERHAIELTLDLLGITIEGVND